MSGGTQFRRSGCSIEGADALDCVFSERGLRDLGKVSNGSAGDGERRRLIRLSLLRSSDAALA
ncbi:hypothetical protein GCM10007872_12310 [Gluconobacter sphaericus NBRC 12467]|uniref:Uncharacterized protein n=1 Tax=Gluconobacter sphaericus NBRC 12467 TaxID=1307951 RepID=A0AA37WAY0_9PROT|nr:hypothetical protein AA12467_0316 [Gluconobacter sphaericus NBRC 12467]GEB41721.1 hypothetical protein GSP01_05030 [Gluconobacter sphaericus NBRC 12467]GLQ84323.1 hypothetical protein GCM10007872_12310 [Gluconobacter sphaericus NBRC 12467]